MKRILLLATLLSFARRSDAQNVAAREIGDSVSCPECRISLAVIVTPRSASGQTIARAPAAVALDGVGRYWIAEPLELPRVYSREGRLIRVIGTKGAKEGQFAGVALIASVGSDSVLVRDGLNLRSVVFDRNLREVRSIRTPTPLVGYAGGEWPRSVTFTGFVHSEQSAGWPLHQLDFGGDSIRVIRSFGPDNGRLTPNSDPDLLLRVEPGRDGDYWTADVVKYRLSHWSREGKLLASITRKAKWFAGTQQNWSGNPTTPPPPQVTAIQRDSAGLLWVFVRTAAPDWKSAWPAGAAGRKEFAFGEIRFDRLFRTTVEVIDPAAGVVVARQVLDSWITGNVSVGRVAVLRHERGSPQLGIASVSLGRRTLGSGAATDTSLLAPPLRLAYAKVWDAAMRGDLAAIAKLAPLVPGFVEVNEQRGALQVRDCKKQTVIASLPLESAADSLAVSLVPRSRPRP